MPLHLILIMTAAIAFMLWLAFQDDGEAELGELEGDADTHPDLRFADNDAEVRRPAA
jgi:hypothetical protein